MTPNEFCFDGKSSYGDMDFVISRRNYMRGGRDREYLAIAGRNGDLLQDNRRYRNDTVVYECVYFGDDHATAEDRLSDWLLRPTGYAKLSDTYDPGYYRMATLEGGLNVGSNLRLLEPIELTFVCQPIKYYFSGAERIVLTAPGKVYNPGNLPSAPKIMIAGFGNITLSIGSKSYAIDGVDDLITLDSDIQAAYNGEFLQNNKLRFYDFPALLPGENGISWSGDVESVTIIPRWCSL